MVGSNFVYFPLFGMLYEENSGNPAVQTVVGSHRLLFT
jgi:hypothetical protein